MDDAQKIIDFIQYAERLKVELRLASRSDSNRESVAEHCWRVSLMLVLIVPKLEIKIDFLKILKMAIIHDLVEIDAKDVPILESIDNEDRNSLKEKNERLAIDNIKKMLGTDGQDIYGLWNEFEEGISNEAKVLKVIDRLEGQMQFLSESVTNFTEQDQTKIKKLLEETTELSKIDPFMVQLDEKTLENRKDRIKY